MGGTSGWKRLGRLTEEAVGGRRETDRERRGGQTVSGAETARAAGRVR